MGLVCWHKENVMVYFLLLIHSVDIMIRIICLSSFFSIKQLVNPTAGLPCVRVLDLSCLIREERVSWCPSEQSWPQRVLADPGSKNFRC